MNYEDMSDFAINKAVAIAIEHEIAGDGSQQGKRSCVTVVRRRPGCMPSYVEVDYCNNPSDAWPIIDRHKICIHNDEMEGRSYACSFDKFGYVSKESYCDKTLRAAMIVFLMMQEQDK